MGTQIKSTFHFDEFTCSELTVSPLSPAKENLTRTSPTFRSVQKNRHKGNSTQTKFARCCHQGARSPLASVAAEYDRNNHHGR